MTKKEKDFELFVKSLLKHSHLVFSKALPRSERYRDVGGFSSMTGVVSTWRLLAQIKKYVAKQKVGKQKVSK